jgi:tetratricopeptide (TPR) repeat protein
VDECLAGKHPFAAPTREVLYQNILAGQATALGRGVPRDVSVIVQTAMSLSPDHRYDSANAFADDLRSARLLEPIEARRPNSLERTMRCRQRQPLVACLIAALLAIASVSAWLAIDANNSRITAEQQAETRERVSRFLVDLFEVPNGNTYRGQTITAREGLDQGFRKIQNGLTEEPAIRAQLMITMGEVYQQLGMLGSLQIETGNLKKAKELLEDALAKHRRLLGSKAAPVGRCLLFLGEVEGIQRKHEPAIKRFREAYTVLSEALGDPHPYTQVAIGYLVLHLKATKSGEVKEWQARLK